MFILPCFCWSQCCYHRNRRSSRTSRWESGATSLICRSARPAASQALQEEIPTAADTDLGLLALQLGGKPDWDRPYRTGSRALRSAEKSTKTLWGYRRPSKSSQWLQWSLRHRHTHKAHHHRFSSWLLVVSTANSAWAFYNHSSSCHILISCQRDAYVFPFPLSLAQWWQRQVLLEIFYSLPRKMNCLALYWSAASLALFHENTLLSMQADTYIFQCWVQLPHLLTLTTETKRPICWEKHSGIIL